MKLYFDFYNDAGVTKYIYLNDVNNRLNINLDKFNMTAHIDTDLKLDFQNITDFFLVIEKEVNGTYILEKKINGNYSSGIITYEKCNFDDVISNSSSYRLYFQFNEGGIIVYNGKDKPYYINLKTKCEDFDIDIYDSILIKDIYEIQKINTELSSITFKMSIINNKNFNNYRYFYVFSNSIEYTGKEINYKILTENELTVTEPISISSFEKGITYLHFYLKDTFDNISHRVFKITTKQNTLTLFEIINKEISLVGDEQFSIFYKSRNIKSVTPVIEVTDSQNVTKTYVSKKTIGTFDLNSNVITFKLSEYFEETFANNKLFLYFRLNENENDCSNKMLILLDSVAPEISITNFDSNNYKLITTDEKIVNVIGQIKDENFFYLGNNRQKIDLTKAKHYLIVYSESNVHYVTFDDSQEKIEFLKHSNFYITESKGSTFKLYTKDEELISNDSYQYINDFVKPDTKNFYIVFDKKELSQYELNIIEHQGGLKIKGETISPLIIKQEFNKFVDLYYIKAEINISSVDTVPFDVGIDGFGYSFLSKVNFSNISCNLTNKKEIDLSFTKTNFIVFKSNKDVEIAKFTDNKVIEYTSSKTYKELSFCPISLSDIEYFSPSGEYMHWDDALNSYPYEEIYSKPKLLDKNKTQLTYSNYKVSELSKGLYSFNFNIKIEDGINKNTLEYADIIGNKTSVEFTIEKNTNNIKILIDELYNKSFNKFQSSENSYELSTNRSTINIKFIIENETLNNIESDSYLVIKSNGVYKKQKIVNELKQRVVYAEFSNLTEEKIEFFVYYNNDIKETITFTIENIKTLTLNVISKFISGFNYYYLKYDIDDFANIKVSSNNKNIICNIQPNNKVIEIVRVDYVSFLDKADIEILVTDQHNLYIPVKQIVSAIFYNDNIISDYFINDMFSYKILNQQFNLNLHSAYRDKIEYIKYYDKLETDIFKRNKYAVYDSKTSNYIINGIITPIIPSSIEISIKVTGEDLIINKRLYEDDKISLYEEKKNFIINYIKENKFHIRITNKEKNNFELNKIEFYKNTELLDTINNIIFTNKDYSKDYYYDFDNFYGTTNLVTKLYNQFNKVININSELINFDVDPSLTCKLKSFHEFNLLRKSRLNSIFLESEFDSGTYKLLVKEITGYEKEFKLSVGENRIECENGQYLFELYHCYHNVLKKCAVYNVEIIDDDFTYIDYSREYSKFLNINQIYIRKSINTNFKKLNPQILHYHNNELVNTYTPEYNNEIVLFYVNKFIGENLYVYKDICGEVILDKYIKKVVNIDDNFNIYSVHTNEKALFYDSDKNSITIDKLEDINFKTLGADTMMIKTPRVRTDIEKILVDSIENTLFKEFIPCTLSFYKDNVFIKNISINLSKDEKVELPFFNSPIPEEKNNETNYPILIKNNYSSTNISMFNLPIKHTRRHFLYNYVKNLCILSNIKNIDIEKFISESSEKFYDLYRSNDINKLKEFFKYKLEAEWKK